MQGSLERDGRPYRFVESNMDFTFVRKQPWNASSLLRDLADGRLERMDLALVKALVFNHKFLSASQVRRLFLADRNFTAAQSHIRYLCKNRVVCKYTWKTNKNEMGLHFLAPDEAGAALLNSYLGIDPVPWSWHGNMRGMYHIFKFLEANEFYAQLVTSGVIPEEWVIEPKITAEVHKKTYEFEPTARMSLRRGRFIIQVIRREDGWQGKLERFVPAAAATGQAVLFIAEDEEHCKAVAQMTASLPAAAYTVDYRLVTLPLHNAWWKLDNGVLTPMIAEIFRP
jgi:hypothetical protein